MTNEAKRNEDTVEPLVRPAVEEPFFSPALYYGLTGTCCGCRRVSWLCRRDRRCSKYNQKPKRGYVALPTGYGKPNTRITDSGKG